MILIAVVVIVAMGVGAFVRTHSHHADRFVTASLDLVMLVLIPIIGYAYATRPRAERLDRRRHPRWLRHHRHRRAPRLADLEPPPAPLQSPAGRGRAERGAREHRLPRPPGSADAARRSRVPADGRLGLPHQSADGAPHRAVHRRRVLAHPPARAPWQAAARRRQARPRHPRADRRSARARRLGAAVAARRGRAARLRDPAARLLRRRRHAHAPAAVRRRRRAACRDRARCSACATSPRPGSSSCSAC